MLKLHHLGSLPPTPPMSNAERQRRFRERNPGYRERFRHRSSTNTATVLAQYTERAAAKLRAEREADHNAPRIWFASA